MDKEKAILTAARQVFLTKGLDGARMQEIADLAGTNKALIHYYYRSKDNLYRIVLKELMSEFFHSVLQVLDNEYPLDQKVEAFFDHYTSFLQQNPMIARFILTEVGRNPSEVMEFFSVPKEFGAFNKLNIMLEASIRDGEIRQISAIDFLLNLLSLTIFPALAQPILVPVLNLDEQAYEQLLERRKKTIPKLFMKSLQ